MVVEANAPIPCLTVMNTDTLGQLPPHTARVVDLVGPTVVPDDARISGTRWCRRWVAERSIRLLFRPSCSPNRSRIERP